MVEGDGLSHRDRDAVENIAEIISTELPPICVLYMLASNLWHEEDMNRGLCLRASSANIRPF